MQIKIDRPKGKTNAGVYDNTGSCSRLSNYLEKENDFRIQQGKGYLEMYFNQSSDNILPEEVIYNIDNNRKKLGKDDAKFFHISINPSKEELKHIGKDNGKLKDYTVAVMDEYAKNFGKGLTVDDLMFYAKVEYNRYYTGNDQHVKKGFKKQGDRKPGDQRHIHVIVARKSANGKVKLSPLTNHSNTKKGAVKGGFSRIDFIVKSEKTFDSMFKYKREDKESFVYKLSNKNKNTDYTKRAKYTYQNSTIDKKGFKYSNNNNKAAKEALYGIKNLSGGNTKLKHNLTVTKVKMSGGPIANYTNMAFAATSSYNEEYIAHIIKLKKKRRLDSGIKL